jgi:hypothetical protein
MINKKIVIAFMVVYLVCTLAVFSHSALLSYFVSQLAPATAAATTGGANVAAKIAATAAGGSASKWVSLFVPGAGLAKIGALGLAIGLTIAGDYIYDECKDWFEAQNIDRNGRREVTESFPAGTVPDNFKFNAPRKSITGFPVVDPSYAYLGNVNYVFMGIFTTQAAASNAMSAYVVIANMCQKYAPQGYWKECVSPYYLGESAVSRVEAWNAPTGSPQTGIIENGIDLSKYSYVAARRGWQMADSQYNVLYCFLFFYPKSGVPVVKNTYKKQLTEDELEALMAANMTNSLAEGILREAARIIGGSDFKTAAPANYTVIQNTLNDAVTTQNKTDVEAAIPETVEDAVENSKADITAAVIAALKAQGLSASQIAAAIAAVSAASAGGLTVDGLNSALSSAGLTADQIAAAVAAAAPALTQTNVKTAVKEAIDDETDVTIPVDPTIVLPDKLSLTKVMNDFWDSVQELPIFNVLNGITINTSGTSYLCVDLPAAYGGRRCYNGANVQDELNMIGTAILGLTTVISFIGVFKG